MLTGTAIQIASTFDCSSLGEPIGQALDSANLPLEVRITLPAHLQDHMLAPSDDSEDIIGTLVLVRLEDWLRPVAASSPALTDAIARQQLRNRIDEFLSHLAVLSLRGRPVWLVVCPSAGWIADQTRLATLCRTMTNLFLVRVKNTSQVEVLPFPSALAADTTYIDRESDKLRHVPFTQTGWEELARDLASQLARSAAAKDPDATVGASGSPELAAFLTGLKVAVRLTPAGRNDVGDLSRILRTAASFSLAGEHPTMSDADAAAILAAGGCYIVHVTDRLSQYGTAGVVVAKSDGDALLVSTLSLSCTVLGKQVEYALLQAIAQLAVRSGLSKLVFDFQPTPRNQSAATFLRTALEPISEKRYDLDVESVDVRIQKCAIAPGGWTVEVSPG